MVSAFSVILFIILVLIVLQFAFVIWNVSHLRRVQADMFATEAKSAEDQSMLLSVLIPARNEEHNIGPCLDSVIKAMTNATQKWDHLQLEIIVLDDHSSDGTADAVRRRQPASAHPPQLLVGDDLPPGWMGKSWACHQLAGHARGRWLLFLDADARLEPDALVRICDVIVRQSQGMLTGFPRQIVRGVLERLVVPMMAFTIACHLPIRFVKQSADAKFAAAHGAFICIARKTYDASGGHEAFRAHLVDDVMLARSVKRAGHSLFLMNVTDLVNMRMYQTNREVWSGYKKNIFPGMGRNHLIFAFILLSYSCLYVLPFVMMLLFISDNQWQQAWRHLFDLQAVNGNEIFDSVMAPFYATLAYTISVMMKALIDGVNRAPWWHALFLPLSILLMLMIMIDSWRTTLMGKTYEWKGRRYS